MVVCFPLFEFLQGTALYGRFLPFQSTGRKDAGAFNLIIGNADAHGKNFSLLYSASNGVVLAPLYDLLCKMAWPRVPTRMAMKIGGAGTLEELSPQAWEKVSEATGLRMPFVHRQVLELCQLAADIEQDL